MTTERIPHDGNGWVGTPGMWRECCKHGARLTDRCWRCEEIFEAVAAEREACARVIDALATKKAEDIEASSQARDWQSLEYEELELKVLGEAASAIRERKPL